MDQPSFNNKYQIKNTHSMKTGSRKTCNEVQKNSNREKMRTGVYPNFVYLFNEKKCFDAYDLKYNNNQTKYCVEFSGFLQSVNIIHFTYKI